MLSHEASMSRMSAPSSTMTFRPITRPIYTDQAARPEPVGMASWSRSFHPIRSRNSEPCNAGWDCGSKSPMWTSPPSNRTMGRYAGANPAGLPSIRAGNLRSAGGSTEVRDVQPARVGPGNHAATTKGRHPRVATSVRRPERDTDLSPADASGSHSEQHQDARADLMVRATGRGRLSRLHQ